MMVEGEQNTPAEGQEVYRKVTELNFDQVVVGSEILVFTGDKPEEVTKTPNYRIMVTGKRKTGLLVTVERSEGMEGFTARMPGSRKGSYPNTPEWYSGGGPRGVLERELKVADSDVAYKLYFENLKNLEGKRDANAMTTAPIRKILFKR